MCTSVGTEAGTFITIGREITSLLCMPRSRRSQRRSEPVKSIHVAILLSSALVTMLGIAASGGTYLMTMSLHPFDVNGFKNFIINSPQFAMALLEEQRARIAGRSPATERVLKDLQTVSKLAEINRERRDISLVGVGLLFIGFVLQAVGVACSIVDIAVIQFSATPIG